MKKNFQKSYFLIPLPSTPPKKAPPVYHEVFQKQYLTGRITLQFSVTSTYLFVGSGEFEYNPSPSSPQADIWYTFYRIAGKLAIPGTSLKGAIRAILEAISNSCISQRRKIEKLSSQFEKCQFDFTQPTLCPACRLFGTTGFRGRLSFSDAFPLSKVQTEIVKIKELWSPSKKSNLARRFYYHQQFQKISKPGPQKNHRFLEAVPKDTLFRCTLFFENLSQAELGLLFHSLGWQEDPEEGEVTIAFSPKLGGAKPRCFGAVDFLVESIELLSPPFSLTPISEKELYPWLAQCLKKSQESLLHRDSYQKFLQEAEEKESSCQGEYNDDNR